MFHFYLEWIPPNDLFSCLAGLRVAALRAARFLAQNALFAAALAESSATRVGALLASDPRKQLNRRIILPEPEPTENVASPNL